MIRKVAIGVVALVFACAIAAAFFFDAVAARVVSTAGTRVLGTATTVRSIHIGLIGGSSSLDGLSIAQPKGFGDGAMITVASATATAGLFELLSSEIVIDSIEIRGVTVYIVEVGQQVNLQVVAATVVGSDANPAPATETVAPAKSASASVAIRQLKVSDIKVVIQAETQLPGGKPIEFTIPDIVVSDVGTKTTINEVASEVTTELMDRLLLAIVQAHIKGLPNDMMSGLTSASSTLSGAASSVIGEGGEVIRKTIDGASNAIKGIFGDK